MIPQHASRPETMVSHFISVPWGMNSLSANTDYLGASPASKANP